jgi:Fe-S-cluster containining protein
MPVLPEYLKILENARQMKKENKSFLDKLKKIKPHDLDLVTNRFHEKAFQKIDCLHCANCCTTTGPMLKNRDINTLSAHFKMRESAFAEKYLRRDEDGDHVFLSMPCPFLGSDNYCSVYSARPGACRDYPHTHQRDIAEKIPVTYLNSLICPAVAVIIGLLRNYYGKKMHSSKS